MTNTLSPSPRTHTVTPAALTCLHALGCKLSYHCSTSPQLSLSITLTQCSLLHLLPQVCFPLLKALSILVVSLTVGMPGFSIIEHPDLHWLLFLRLLLTCSLLTFPTGNFLSLGNFPPQIQRSHMEYLRALFLVQFCFLFICYLWGTLSVSVMLLFIFKLMTYSITSLILCETETFLQN